MDNVDNVEGPRVQLMNNDDIKLLYTSLFGLSTPFDLVSLAFAVFLVVFGLIGYLEAGSIISLVASVGISVPILIGSYLCAAKHIYWSILTLAATLLLFVMMSIRYYKSSKFYPAGVVAAVSFVFLSFLITRLLLFYFRQ